LKQVVSDEQRRHNRRYNPPPSKHTVNQHITPKVTVNARLTEVAFDRLGPARDQHPDILLELDSSRLRFETTGIATHRWFSLMIDE
jgi:hypothetical protein